MKKETKIPERPASVTEKENRRGFSAVSAACLAIFTASALLMFPIPVFAATNIWTEAKEIMQDVYNQILLISTVAAIVTASVALLMMNFSRSGRTVDESRAWLKRSVSHGLF